MSLLRPRHCGERKKEREREREEYCSALAQVKGTSITVTRRISEALTGK
jgi:hypothetical protein